MALNSKTAKARLALARRNQPNALDPLPLIEKALHDSERPVVCWSGGRCSTAVLHMAVSLKPDIDVVFNNTGVEYPETVPYVREMAEKWSLNFHEVKPETNFWAIVKKHGFPQIRGGDHSLKDRRPKCCELLKEKPSAKFYRENHVDAIITGVRAEESRTRALAAMQFGQSYYSTIARLWKYHPIQLWDTNQLKNYLEDNAVSINPVYKRGIERCGCMPCTGFLHWQEQLSKANPRYYKWLNREYQKSQGRLTLWEFHDVHDCRQEAQP